MLSLTLAMVSLLSMPVYANEKEKILPENMNASVGASIDSIESEEWAEAMCSISNAGKGKIAVYASSTMYEKVEWAKITLYLQRYVTTGSTTGWITVKTITKEAKDVSTLTIDQTITDQPAGYYYRVATFQEIQPYNGSYQTKSPYTDGVMITNP